ncbi:MAG: hypothetical protein H0T62_14505 [Parachlamydiaceae bacterium]|nr:hypothetical protein [Parachlamydiaceae bacterium]
MSISNQSVISKPYSIKNVFQENNEAKNELTLEILFYELVKKKIPFEANENGEKLTNLVRALNFSSTSLKKCLQNGLPKNQIINFLEARVTIATGKKFASALLEELNAILEAEIPRASISNPHLNVKEFDETSSVLLSEVETLMANLIKTAKEKATALLGCSIIKHNFKLQYEDVKTHAIHTMDTAETDCISYAFYKIHEEKAQHWIFNKTLKVLDVEDVMQALLKEFKYKLVNEPQEGDLICYLKNNQMRHFGVMVDTQTVHSKWGQLTSIISHPIDTVSAADGLYYLLFRKENNNGYNQPWVLDSTLVNV